ncbi:Hypothetical_protein [Hexamita inflata]|uniref:Hypothetical_protein n=1 Tax=Hexamita inflata TaxID=28002 RepID=A0AA86RDP4_9EUKA|nr:Hypothetical protein HINF_LOCUS7338 [Hexamita inflata]CAI9972111.1 Hypothetical protein HINF_LOCUS59756 [Hexamita inflata]
MIHDRQQYLNMIGEEQYVQQLKNGEISEFISPVGHQLVFKSVQQEQKHYTDSQIIAIQKEYDAKYIKVFESLTNLANKRNIEVGPLAEQLGIDFEIQVNYTESE